MSDLKVSKMQSLRHKLQHIYLIRRLAIFIKQDWNTCFSKYGSGALTVWFLSLRVKGRLMSDCAAFIKAECVFVHITNQLFPVSAGVLFTFNFLHLRASSIDLSESGVVQTVVYFTDCIANKSNCRSTHAITSFWNQETGAQSPRNKISSPWEGRLLSHYALQPSLKRPTEPFSFAANIPSVYWSAARCHTAALSPQGRKCSRGLNKRCLELEWQLLLEERAGMCVCELAAFLLPGLRTHADDVCDRGCGPVRSSLTKRSDESMILKQRTYLIMKPIKI